MVKRFKTYDNLVYVNVHQVFLLKTVCFDVLELHHFYAAPPPRRVIN
jgi:hypothetical protein